MARTGAGKTGTTDTFSRRGLFQIEPGAESATRTRQQHHPDLGIIVRCLEGIVQLTQHLTGDGVHRFRPVQNDPTGVPAVLDQYFAHGILTALADPLLADVLLHAFRADFSTVDITHRIHRHTLGTAGA